MFKTCIITEIIIIKKNELIPSGILQEYRIRNTQGKQNITDVHSTNGTITTKYPINMYASDV